MKKLSLPISLSFIFVIMAVSCSHDGFKGRNQWDGLYTHDTIDIGAKQELEIGNHLIDSISYLVLEYLDDYPVGGINRLLFMDDYIVVVDKRGANAVYLFDYKGKFHRQISSQGTGPGEYADLSNVTLSADGKQIIIQDRARRNIMWFDVNGKLTRTKALPAHSGDIVPLDENTWATSLFPSNRNVTKRGKNPFFIVTDSLWNFNYALDFPKKFHEPFNIIPTPLAKTPAGNVNGFITSDRRMYRFTTDSVYIEYRFLLNDGMDGLDWEDAYYSEPAPNSKRILHPVLDCGDYVSFGIHENDELSYMLYSKKERNTYIMDFYYNNDVMYYFLNQVQFCCRNTIVAPVSANTFYSLVDRVGRESSPLFHEIAGKTNAESNPVLVFYHLK